MCSVVKEVILTRRPVQGLGIPSVVDKPTSVRVGDQGGMKMASNFSFNYPKHIVVRYHFTRKGVADRAIVLDFCPIKGMIAEIMTKSLRRIKFKRFAEEYGLQIRKSAVSKGSRGGVEV